MSARSVNVYTRVCIVLDPFPTVTDTQVHRPAVGRDLVLECRPPASYPTGNIYWGISRPDSNQLKAIDNNDRVMLGYDGKISPPPLTFVTRLRSTPD